MSNDLTSLSFSGHSLVRPECAVAHVSGCIFAPDWTGDGGVCAILSDGAVKRHLALNWPQVSSTIGLSEPLRPNGICLMPGGDFLIAHLGEEFGGVFRLTPHGTVTPFLLEIDGVRLPPTNFVTVDEEGRIWITISTRQVPRANAYRSDVADGFVVLMEDGVTRIVADGLGYTNECLVHPDGKRLFVNETFARRLTSFDIEPDGSLVNRTTIAEFGAGVFPDGLTFDENGDVWITSIVSNWVLRVDGAGNAGVFLEDADPTQLEWVEEAYQKNTMGRPHLDNAAGRVLRSTSNLAFCGEQLDEAVLGCLLGDRLAKISMPVRGHQPVHWTFDIAPLIKALEKIEPVEA